MAPCLVGRKVLGRRPSCGRSCARRKVLPSMAMTSAGVPVVAASQATKQRWKDPRRGSRKYRLRDHGRAHRREKAGNGAGDRASFRRNGLHRRRFPRPPAQRGKTQQQNFVQRTGELARLPMIQQLSEIKEINSVSAQASRVSPPAFIQSLPESKDFDRLASHAIVIHFFTLWPWLRIIPS